MTGNTLRRGGVLREGYDYDFSPADPATGAHVDPAWCAIYETDTLADASGRLGPMLATSWKCDPDGVTWRFAVREGARYHSGAACDAAAIAAAHNLHRDPVVSPVNAFFWKAVKDVWAEDGMLVLRLHHPSAGMPRLLRSWHSGIHNQASREAAGDDWGKTTADGTGPFVFSKIENGIVQEVRRWDEYPGTAATWFENRGPAYLDAVQWIPLLDEAERAAALEAGEVDAIQNPGLLDVDRLAANPDLEVITYQQSALAYLALDHETSALGFDDLRVRQAVSHAINREAIVESDLGGYGWAAQGPVPSASHWYASEVERYNTYDPERSRRLLDAAGLEPNGDGVRLEFTALLLQDATLMRAAETVRSMLGEVGIRLNLDLVEGFEAFYGAVGQHPPAFISKWLWPDPVDATIGFVTSWSHAGPNWQRASIPAIDAACRRFQEAETADQEVTASRDIQVLSAEHLPLIPLYFPATAWAHHRKVRGWRPTPTNLYPFYADVWLDES